MTIPKNLVSVLDSNSNFYYRIVWTCFYNYMVYYYSSIMSIVSLIDWLCSLYSSQSLSEVDLSSSSIGVRNKELYLFLNSFLSLLFGLSYIDIGLLNKVFGSC